MLNPKANPPPELAGVWGLRLACLVLSDSDPRSRLRSLASHPVLEQETRAPRHLFIRNKDVGATFLFEWEDVKSNAEKHEELGKLLARWRGMLIALFHIHCAWFQAIDSVGRSEHVNAGLSVFDDDEGLSTAPVSPSTASTCSHCPGRLHAPPSAPASARVLSYFFP